MSIRNPIIPENELWLRGYQLLHDINSLKVSSHWVIVNSDENITPYATT